MRKSVPANTGDPPLIAEKPPTLEVDSSNMTFVPALAKWPATVRSARKSVSETHLSRGTIPLGLLLMPPRKLQPPRKFEANTATHLAHTGPSMLGRVPSVVLTIVGTLDVYPVDTRSRVMEHRSALGSRVASGQPFEGVIQHVVRVGHLIHGEVAFKHTPVGAELLDAIRHQGGHRRRQLCGADGRLPGMPIKTGAGHADATEFDGDVGAC